MFLSKISLKYYEIKNNELRSNFSSSLCNNKIFDLFKGKNTNYYLLVMYAS